MFENVAVVWWSGDEQCYVVYAKDQRSGKRVRMASSGTPEGARDQAFALGYRKVRFATGTRYHL